MKSDLTKINYRKTKNNYGSITVDPLPSPEELIRFYADIYYQENASNSYAIDYPDDELKQRRLRAELMMHSIQKANSGRKAEGPFLEVGCGEGFVLQAAQDKGYDIHGIDFSDYGLKKLHPELEQKVEFGDAYQILDKYISNKRQFRFCVMQNVLEHVIDPAVLLKNIRNILLEDGMVLATVPNDYSRLQEKALDTGNVDKEYWFLPPQHLHYFNVDTINDFADYCGYEVVDSYADFPIDFFVFHPGSNYVKNKDNGGAAHSARLTLDLLLAERGMESYYRFYQSLSACGMGRNVTVLMRPKI